MLGLISRKKRTSAERLERLAARYASSPEFLFVPAQSINEPGPLTGDAVLHLAVIRNKLRDVEEAIGLGADVNQPGDLGFTPLHYAVDFGTLRIVISLLNAGARRSTRNEWGQTAHDVLLLGENPKRWGRQLELVCALVRPDPETQAVPGVDREVSGHG